MGGKPLVWNPTSMEIVWGTGGAAAMLSSGVSDDHLQASLSS